MNWKKNYFVTFLSGFGGAAVSTTLGLISAPISLSYWGEERYGLWAILLSVLSYLSVSNFGIGQAATTLVGKNNLFNNKRKILFRAAICLASSIAISVISLLVINLIFPDWHKALGKIPIRLETEARDTSLFIILFFFVNLPFTLASSALIGTQRAYIENLFQIGGTIVNFIGLISVVLLKLALPWDAIFNGVLSLGLNLIKVAIAFSGKRSILRAGSEAEESNDADKASDTEYRTLLATSARFFLIWLAATLVWNTDNFVVSNVIGLKEVTPYSITFKFYNLLFTAIFIVNNSLLPLMAKEFGAGNWEWIKKNFMRFSTIGSSLGGLALIGGLSFGHDFVLLWTGEKGYAGIGVMACLGTYSYLLSMVNFNSGMINTFNYTKGTWAFAFLEGGIKIGASLLLGKAFGLAGIAAGTMLGSLLAPTWICPLILKGRSGGRLIFPWRRTVAHFALILLPLGTIGFLVQARINHPFARIGAGFAITAAYVAATIVSWPADMKGDLNAARAKILKVLWKR